MRTGTTDPRSLVTTSVRDGFGDVIQETSPDRGTTVYDYDARGLMISRRDARGKQTTYGYDNAGRLVSASYPATPALDVAYTYDGSAAGPNGIGHVTHVQDAAGTTDFTYDAVGRVTSETRSIGGASSTVSYGWDASGSGRLHRMTLPSGFMLTYDDDALGRPNQMSVSLDTRIPLTPVVGNITYFPFGGLQQVNSYNGVARYQSNDLDYRINGLFITKGSTALVDRYFAFDDKLNLTQINNNSTDANQSQSLNYDDAQRLTYAAGSYGTRLWQYDVVGNRLSEGSTPAGSSTTQASTYAYPAGSNQLTSVTQGATTRAFSYDAAGNTIQDNRNGTLYAYGINDAGRIAQLTIGTTATANYLYDAKDRLSVRQTLNTSPSGTTHDVYDVWNDLIAETDVDGQPIREYMWVGGEPVAVIDWTVSSGSPTLFYVHTDHLHRPELMTDTSGNVVWRASYEPFGAVSSITGSLTQNQRFPGQWFQLESGLAYNWHRHYDPTLGRYTNTDPLGSRGGVSLFGYVGQNPLLFTDKRCLDNPGLGPSDPPVPPSPNNCSSLRPSPDARLRPTPVQFFPPILEEPPILPYPYPIDPTLPPGEGFRWRGPPNDPVGTGKGSWYNDSTKESIRPDLDHPPPIGPHYDYNYRGSGTDGWRWYPGGLAPKA